MPEKVGPACHTKEAFDVIRKQPSNGFQYRAKIGTFCFSLREDKKGKGQGAGLETYRCFLTCNKEDKVTDAEKG